MTATLPAADAAKTATNIATLGFMLSLVHPDDATRDQVRDLVIELDEIAAERQIAARMVPESVQDWLTDLDAKERAVRQALRELTRRSPHYGIAA